MKVIAMFFAVLVMIIPVYSQEPYDSQSVLFGENDYEIGGIGAFVLKGTSINGQFTILQGVRAAVIIDHNFYFGAGFYNSLLETIKAEYKDPNANKKPYLEYNSYNLEFEYVISPESLVNYSGMLSLGVGNVGYELDNWEWDDGSDYDPDYGEDWFLIVEPQLNATINMTSWFRVSAGVGYRFCFDVDYSFGAEQYQNSDLSSYTATIMLRFGKF